MKLNLILTYKESVISPRTGKEKLVKKTHDYAVEIKEISGDSVLAGTTVQMPYSEPQKVIKYEGDSYMSVTYGRRDGLDYDESGNELPHLINYRADDFYGEMYLVNHINGYGNTLDEIIKSIDRSAEQYLIVDGYIYKKYSEEEINEIIKRY